MISSYAEKTIRRIAILAFIAGAAFLTASLVRSADAAEAAFMLVWSCPDAEGAVAIAEADSEENAVAAANRNGCGFYNFPMPAQPVKYIGEAHDPMDDRTLYVWQFIELAGETVYTFADEDFHGTLSQYMKDSAI